MSDPFGEALPHLDPDGNGVAFDLSLRFPGQIHDPETGLHYNYFRDYSPSTGRYVQSDPIGLNGGIIIYAYVENNPLNRVDPYGLRGTGAATGGVCAALLFIEPTPFSELICGCIAIGVIIAQSDDINISDLPAADVGNCGPPNEPACNDDDNCEQEYNAIIVKEISIRNDISSGPPSASSSLNFWIKPLQLTPCVIDLELPIHAPLPGIGFLRSDGDFGLQFIQFTDPTITQALARQATEFAFCHIQPAAVFGGVTKGDAFEISPRLLRLKGFVESPFGMSIEVIQHQGHRLTLRVACIQ